MSYVSLTDHPAPELIHEPDEIAQWLAWGIVAAFAAWAAWGWLNDGINALSLLLAVVFGLFQVATNILAVKMRELWAKGAWITAIAACAAMVATGLLTHESLNHAYAEALEDGLVTADPALMSWLLLIVPYLEPLLFWINRILVEPSRAEPVVRMGLIPLIGLFLFGPPASPPPQAPPHEPQPIARSLPRPQARNLDDPARAQARLMLRQGLRPRAVHDATGVPLSTLKRWAQAA